MAGFIDYSRVGASNYTGQALSELSAAIDGIMARRQAARLQRERMQHEADLAGLTDKRLREQSEREWLQKEQETEFRRSEAERRAQGEERDRAMKAANPMIGAMKNLDPGAARMWGELGGMSVGPAGPKTDDAELDQLMQGAVDGRMPPRQQPQEPPQEMPELPGMLGGSALQAMDLLQAHKARQAAERAQAEERKRARMFSIGMPGGGQVEFDPDAETAGQAARGQEAAERMAGLGGNQYRKRASAEIQDLLRSGFVKPDEAGGKLMHKEEKFESEANAEKRAHIAGQRASLAHPEGARAVPDFEGNLIGNATTEGEAKAVREKAGQLRSIVDKLGQMRSIVESMDWTSRAPIVGGFTEEQQKLKGALTLITAPVSQALGSGTPQDQEAKRFLDTITVSPGQSKAVALANIAAVEAFMRDYYAQKAAAVVPGYKPKAQKPQPSRKALDAEADAILGGGQ